MPVFALTAQAPAVQAEPVAQTATQTTPPTDQPKQFKVMIDGPLSQVYTATLMEMFKKDNELATEMFMTPIIAELTDQAQMDDFKPDLYIYACDADNLDLAVGNDIITKMERMQGDETVTPIVAMECKATFSRSAVIVEEYARKSKIRTVIRRHSAINIAHEALSLK